MNDGAQKNNPYPIVDAQEAPRESPQKLGLRASAATTPNKVGVVATSRGTVSPARTAPACAASIAPRTGSRTVNFSSGVIRSPDRPTMKNAMRQLMRLV